MADTPIGNVSDTAFWVAHYRAVESARPDALFRDPFAARLAGKRGKEISESMPMAAMTGWVLAMRTLIIDDFIEQAVAAGVDTVLNLGAGLDTRPYRMNLPATLQWFEADYPAMIDYKEECLARETPRTRLERVRIDLGDRASRRAMLGRINSEATKLLVLTEGVLPYLTAEQVGDLAGDLHSLAALRDWIAEYHSPQVYQYREREGFNQKLRNAPFQFKPEDWFGFFEARGWRARKVRYLLDEADRVGRPIPLPRIAQVAMVLRGLALSKQKRAGLRNFAAYILLEPFEI